MTGTELMERIDAVGREVREPLRSAVEEVAGRPPRPSRLTRTLGLDKSLASRIVRAINSETNHEFVHRVPSPAGLAILLDRGGTHLSPETRGGLRAAIGILQEFFDRTPGGRGLIDAHIADALSPARERQEKTARHGAFRSMSFVLGHYCERLVTALFLIPSTSGDAIDAIEIHHRAGLRRLRPSRPLALVRVRAGADVAGAPGAVLVEPLRPSADAPSPLDYVLPVLTRPALPRLFVTRTDTLVTVSLPGDPDAPALRDVAYAWRIRNGLARNPHASEHSLRTYLLHSPARRLVRYIYLHDDVYPGADMHVAFRLPSPGGAEPHEFSPGQETVDHIDVLAPVEQLPARSLTNDVRPSSAEGAVLRHVVDLAGLDPARFRGWRCAMDYPVPLVEMLWWASVPPR